MARGVGRGGGHYFKFFFFQGGHYSREAINRGAAIIQANTVHNFLSSRRNRSCQRINPSHWSHRTRSLYKVSDISQSCSRPFSSTICWQIKCLSFKIFKRCIDCSSSMCLLITMTGSKFSGLCNWSCQVINRRADRRPTVSAGYQEST